MFSEVGGERVGAKVGPPREKIYRALSTALVSLGRGKVTVAVVQQPSSDIDNENTGR